jgi:hypothetical protein
MFRAQSGYTSLFLQFFISFRRVVGEVIGCSGDDANLGHNFVLSHRNCNSAKRDRLASEYHLRAWVERNLSSSDYLAEQFERIAMLHNLQSTIRIAHWAYNAAATISGLTWHARNTLVPLGDDWQKLLSPNRDTASA